jgi:hypothetical protein
MCADFVSDSSFPVLNVCAVAYCHDLRVLGLAEAVVVNLPFIYRLLSRADSIPRDLVPAPSQQLMVPCDWFYYWKTCVFLIFPMHASVEIGFINQVYANSLLAALNSRQSLRAAINSNHLTDIVFVQSYLRNSYLQVCESTFVPNYSNWHGMLYVYFLL